MTYDPTWILVWCWLMHSSLLYFSKKYLKASWWHPDGILMVLWEAGLNSILIEEIMFRTFWVMIITLMPLVVGNICWWCLVIPLTGLSYTHAPENQIVPNTPTSHSPPSPPQCSLPCKFNLTLLPLDTPPSSPFPPSDYPSHFHQKPDFCTPGFSSS